MSLYIDMNINLLNVESLSLLISGLKTFPAMLTRADDARTEFVFGFEDRTCIIKKFKVFKYRFWVHSTWCWIQFWQVNYTEVVYIYYIHFELNQLKCVKPLFNIFYLAIALIDCAKQFTWWKVQWWITNQIWF